MVTPGFLLSVAVGGRFCKTCTLQVVRRSSSSSWAFKVFIFGERDSQTARNKILQHGRLSGVPLIVAESPLSTSQSTTPTGSGVLSRALIRNLFHGHLHMGLEFTQQHYGPSENSSTEEASLQSSS
ncbi:Uncharacterized protein DAT39_005088 [Clarias magur]|uniref:Uncharacterized protein n=1 Tax=Clarias magur TaxID=1594786 RepID=A0A8J4UM95_CLAMG|nr:Uncharacterized protein DAT39_005088 [Clarias magur]